MNLQFIRLEEGVKGAKTTGIMTFFHESLEHSLEN